MTKGSDDIHMTPKSWTLLLTKYLIEEEKTNTWLGWLKFGIGLCTTLTVILLRQSPKHKESFAVYPVTNKEVTLTFCLVLGHYH